MNGINANQDDQDDQDDPIVPPDATMKKAKKKRKQKQPTDPYAIRYKTKKRKIVQNESCIGKRNCSGKMMHYEKGHLKYYLQKYQHDGYCTNCVKRLIDTARINFYYCKTCSNMCCDKCYQK